MDNACTRGCYSATTKYEILPFATTWRDLESVTLSRVRQRRVSGGLSRAGNLNQSGRSRTQDGLVVAAGDGPWAGSVEVVGRYW